MIKAIIFDLGGVILDMNPLLDNAKEIFRPEEESKFWEEINMEAIPLCKKEITLLQFWKRMARKLGRKIPDNVLKDLWVKDYAKLTSVNKNMKKIVISLKKNYKLAMVSNIINEHAKINKQLGRLKLFNKLFNVVILSNEVNLAKNEKEIFLLTTKKLGVKANECVFIDDVRRFLDVAQSVGMKTILFRNQKQLKADLRKFGVNV